MRLRVWQVGGLSSAAQNVPPSAALSLSHIIFGVENINQYWYPSKLPLRRPVLPAPSRTAGPAAQILVARDRIIYQIPVLTIGVITMGGSEVSTQLELAAIFVAFVAVTTLFSFVSIGASAMGGGSQTGTGTYPVLAAGEPHLAPVGQITGSSSVPEFSGVYVDTLAFVIANTGEDGVVDLSRATVTVTAGGYLEVLTRSRILLPGPGTWTTALARNSDGSIPLRAGEECTVRILLNRPIPAGEIVTVRVRLEGDLPCSITGQAAVPAGDAGGAPVASSLPED